MPRITPSRDHSIWLNHIIHPQGELLGTLRGVKPRELVVLSLDGERGTWRRYKQPTEGPCPEGFIPHDENAKTIWKRLQERGTQVEITFVSSLGPPADPAPSVKKPRGRRKPKPAVRVPPWVSAGGPIQGNVLCLGIDVAWWGGQAGKSNKATRSECLAIAKRLDGCWQPLAIRRIDLTPKNNDDAKNDDKVANADAKAELLAEAIRQIVNEARGDWGDEFSVVVAADVPLRATERKHLPEPSRSRDPRDKKAKKKDDKKHPPVAAKRQCDIAWSEAKKAHDDQWRDFQILPGAPLYPRVRCLIKQLEGMGFTLLKQPNDAPNKRVAIEVFPNEVLWSAGVLGHTDSLNASAIRAYKKIGKAKATLPSAAFLAICETTLYPAMRVAGLPNDVQDDWHQTVVNHLRAEGILTDAPSVGRTGKKFDDCIDSFLSLMAGVAFADGRAHVHLGEDHEDGHIVGPGFTDGLVGEGKASNGTTTHEELN